MNYWVVGVLVGLLVISNVIWFWQWYRLVYRKIHSDAGDKLHPLTGLPTRQTMLLRLLQMLSNLTQVNMHYAVLYIDIDNFNTINDNLGQVIGDKVLQQVAHKLNKLTRKNAVMLAHLDGDEFGVVLQLDANKILPIIRDILHAFNTIFRCEGHDLHLTVSIGACVYPDEADSAESLLQYAATARYAAKQKGKNTYVIYHKKMNSLALERNLIAADLGEALKRKEFVVYYQPKIDVKTGKVVSAEALLRWQHLGENFISPEIFVPVAEELGFINKIGEFVLEEVCRDIEKLNKKGFADLTMAINVSPNQLYQSDVVVFLADVLAKYKIPGKQLEIELTESIIMSNTKKSQLMLNVLTSMGAAIVVDDFSMGSSSLSRLRDYPISMLKIDKIFVKNIQEHRDNAIIVSSIISMAHQLGLQVVAEGVESEEDVEFLQEQNCDYLQGYHYSKPLPFTEYLEFLQQANNN